ncbi:MAG: prepilin-type N-terminal cleavage/methylation domain-containing protein [Proteobacteria bacterium]|nr:prepilin-type N-terminal cleavage/methylation domain-containing protein [Pseudomonadota bacterium]
MITAKQGNKGFTIIEVLIAIAILIISMLAVLNTLVIVTEHNLNNISRDEAIRIAEQKMNELRNTNFSSLADGSSSVTRNIRNLAKTYNIEWTINNFSSNSKVLQVSVKWTYKGIEHQHSITSMVNQDT